MSNDSRFIGFVDRERILGRCASVDIKDPVSGKAIVKAAQMIDEAKGTAKAAR